MLCQWRRQQKRLADITLVTILSDWITPLSDLERTAKKSTHYKLDYLSLGGVNKTGLTFPTVNLVLAVKVAE